MAENGTVNQPFRFSTKRYDGKLGLNYYGYRLYNPAIERWMNRDPLGEEGGNNLYGLVQNDPVNFFASWGLFHYNKPASATVSVAVKIFVALKC